MNLEKYLQSYGQRSSLVLTGYVSEDDLWALYTSAEMFVFPSFYEGFGLPVVEALASGCPVIASTAPSLKEVAGSAAIFVDPKSPPEEWSRAMVRVAESAELRHSLAIAGQGAGSSVFLGNLCSADFRRSQECCRGQGMRKRRFCRIDKNGCVACGGRTFEQRAVISDALASAWGLSAIGNARTLMSAKGMPALLARCRSGFGCFFGAFEGSFRFPGGLRVLHFNQINHLSPALRALGDVTRNLPPTKVWNAAPRWVSL